MGESKEYKEVREKVEKSWPKYKKDSANNNIMTGRNSKKLK